MGSTAITFAIDILESLPSIITMTEKAAKFITDSVSSLKVMQAEGRDPTDAEWGALNATVQTLRDGRPALDA